MEHSRVQLPPELQNVLCVCVCSVDNTTAYTTHQQKRRRVNPQLSRSHIRCAADCNNILQTSVGRHNAQLPHRTAIELNAVRATNQELRFELELMTHRLHTQTAPANEPGSLGSAEASRAAAPQEAHLSPESSSDAPSHHSTHGTAIHTTWPDDYYNEVHHSSPQ